MNLTTMRTAVRTRLGVSPTDSFFPDPQLTDLINEALQATNNEDFWPWVQGTATINTVAGTAAYAVPADWHLTKALYIPGFEPMILSNLQDVDFITVQGQPVAYVVFQDQVVLSPTPDGVYQVTHQYYKQEPNLVADTDTPLMPAEFHYAIVAYASHLAHMRSGEVDYYRGNITGKAAAAYQEYEQWLARMREHRRRSAAPIRPRVRAGSWI